MASVTKQKLRHMLKFISVHDMLLSTTYVPHAASDLHLRWLAELKKQKKKKEKRKKTKQKKNSSHDALL